jgi:chromate reductase, NAD(P)H dehydrogenase (quinone)
MRVLTISGSLRPDSLNTLLLRAAEEQAPAGVEVERYQGLADIPPFHGERTDPAEGAPQPVQELRDLIAGADAVLIATPEYNGSIPGVLKNALDWISTPFPDNVLRGKPVAVIGASTGGYGGMWAQAELRKVLGVTGARVVNGDLSLAKAHEQFDDAGSLHHTHHTRLTGVLDTLLAEVQPVAA